MVPVAWGRFPLVAGHVQAHRWLQFTANLGRAANTVEAYGRAVNDLLLFCTAWEVDPVVAGTDLVAAWIGDLHQRPNPVPPARGRGNGVGLANATIQQRVVAARSFFQYLVEEGLRDRNPVRRGESGRRGRPRQGLVRQTYRVPWIPPEAVWERVLAAAKAESLRNRLMLALAYDGALRREELVQVAIDDFEPAYSLLHLRAETTKSCRAREVAYGQATSALFVAYLRQRTARFGRRHGRLFLSESDRNRGVPIGLWSWSKIVQTLAARSGAPALSTHTFRHLRLTDLARAEWTIDQIAQYAGHRNLSTTLMYIHLSGRELAARFTRTMTGVNADRERLLAELASGPS
ncbi:tyrosine-type recombinase/integrase [Longispora sp. K20-0274]|uniref:tyrosine-type recombinase/integrase n=1 Tax=Longispora sp. K20-0274 TaxID=3088255 RepID=UPI00399B5CD5